MNIKKIYTGQRHTAVLSEEGELFTFGNGNWGSLGHGDESNVKYTRPKQVEFFAKNNLKVKDVIAGEYHTCAITDDGSVYTWGYGGKKTTFSWMFNQEVGALGHGDRTSYFTPKLVEFFP